MGVSFKPSKQYKGGIWEGGPGTLNYMRTCVFDYNGTTDPQPSIHLNITSLEDGAEYDEYWGAGKNLVPTDDGLSFKPTKEGLSDSCNASAGFASILGAGFDEDAFDDDLSVFDDMDCTFARKKITRTIKGETRDSNPLLVVSIERMPGAAKPAKGKPATAKPGTKPAMAPAKAAPGKPAAKAAKVADRSEELQDAIFEILGNQEGPVSKKKVGQLVFQQFKKDPEVKVLMAQAADNDWLFADDRPWTSDADGETVQVG